MAREAGEAMGKHVIEAADGPGFIVNRCNRPFALEALRLVQEGIATPEQVDRICRMGGGFRMGPFELMDLVGLDVGLAVSRSFYEQSFGEPRWRPSPLAARLVAAGRLGRKSGRGWYAYPPGRPPIPSRRRRAAGSGRVRIGGDSRAAAALRAWAAGSGWEVGASDVPGVDDRRPPASWRATAPRSPRSTRAAPAAGFHLLPPLGRLVELTTQPTTAPAALEAAETFFRSLGMHAELVGDAPGLVLGRIVAQLVNEACFALGEGVGSGADIDAGMTLGLNHPRGPFAWGDEIGADAVLAVLAGLQDEYREERYRPAPALVRAARAGTPLDEG